MNNMLLSELKKHSFIRRGSAFFRVNGDGVFQIIKYVREPDKKESLSIGLFSLYSELLPQWFSPQGCIPRYSVNHVLDSKNQNLAIQDGCNLYPFPTQEDILISSGVHWLNSMDTQKKLLEGMICLDMRERGHINWVDRFKIAPYLLNGNYAAAEKVILSILRDHEIAITVNKHLFSDSQKYKEYITQKSNRDDSLRQLLVIIQTRDVQNIEKYLQRNYSNNCRYAAFCQRGCGSSLREP